MENVVPGDLPAKFARKGLQIMKVSHCPGIKKRIQQENTHKVPDVEFQSKKELYQQLRLTFEAPSGRVIFRACACASTPIDPLADAKEITVTKYALNCDCVTVLDHGKGMKACR